MTSSAAQKAIFGNNYKKNLWLEPGLTILGLTRMAPILQKQMAVVQNTVELKMITIFLMYIYKWDITKIRLI